MLSDFERWMKYRWEFMRRTEEYKKDYNRLKSGNIARESDYGLHSDDVNDVKVVVEKFFGKSHSFMPNPDLSYEELPVRGNVSESYNGILLFPGYFAHSSFFAEPLFMKVDELTAQVTITINFDRINSIEQLKKNVSDEIDWRWEFLIQNGIIKKGKRQRYQVDYDLVLKVGDMRYLEDKKNSEIADVIDSKRFRDKPESMIREISRLAKRYKELVSGDWRELTYP